jgi:hypothetical protein
MKLITLNSTQIWGMLLHETDSNHELLSDLVAPIGSGDCVMLKYSNDQHCHSRPAAASNGAAE